MQKTSQQGQSFLAVFPTDCGFGYTRCYDALRFTEWGLERASGDKNTVCVRKFIRLINLHKPTDIILEDIPREQEHERPRTSKLIIALAQISMSQGCTVHFYSRAQIREAFHTHHAFTKHEIATAIGRIVPELQSAVPPKRKVWESDSLAMPFFSAISLALTHFHFEPDHRA